MRSKYGACFALTSGLIDYAGMFPPAKLSFTDTLKRAASWRRESPYPWLLNRVVLPYEEFTSITSRLLLESGADGAPWLFTVLASKGEAWTGAQKDLAGMARFHEREYEGAIRKRAVAYEWKAPEESQLTTAWEKILETVDIAQLLPLTIYVEMAMTESSLQRVDQLRELNRTTPFTFGLKVRTGGVTIPTPTQLAQAIEGAAKAGLKFKATQGLHEVFTHSNAFGFLNLFAALNLRFHSSLTTANLIACLQDDEAKNFTFTPDRFSWRGHLLSTTQIEAARLKHAGAFGSCSLDEPSDSLKKWFGAHL